METRSGWRSPQPRFPSFSALQFTSRHPAAPTQGEPGIEEILNAAQWPGNARRRPLTPNDWARRWFVTVAAATGGIVGSTAAQSWFWDSIRRAVAPERIIFVILLTAVSVFVIGPVEDFVFHPHTAAGTEAGDDTSIVAEMMSHMSVREAGRLVLVLAAFFAANVVHSCFADGASQRSVSILVEMVVAGAAPGVVTYYWAGALQVGADSVGRRAGWASTVMGAMLCGPFFVGVTAKTIDLLLPYVILFMLRLLIVILATMAIALGFSLLVIGSLGYLGGATLDWTRRKPVFPAWLAVGVLAATVAAAATVAVAVSEGVVARLAPATVPHLPSLALPLWVVAGWMLALGVSDFPQIVTEARVQSATESGAPPVHSP